MPLNIPIGLGNNIPSSEAHPIQWFFQWPAEVVGLTPTGPVSMVVDAATEVADW